MNSSRLTAISAMPATRAVYGEVVLAVIAGLWAAARPER